MFGGNEIAMRIEAFVALIVCFLSTCDRRDPQTKMDSPDTNQSNDGGIFLSWRHPVSHRTAILEEIDGMVWLYLSLPQTTEPARDCPAFVTDTPPDSVDWERIKQTGESPGITKDIATEGALIEHPSPEELFCRLVIGRRVRRFAPSGRAYLYDCGRSQTRSLQGRCWQ